MQFGDVAHEVDRLHVGRQRVVLGGVADPLADVGPAPSSGRGRAPRSAPWSGRWRPSIMPEQGGLARAVGAEQAGDAPLHGERGPVERRGRTPPLDDTLPTDDGVGTHALSIVAALAPPARPRPGVVGRWGVLRSRALGPCFLLSAARAVTSLARATC